LNYTEAHEVRKELLGCRLKDEHGNMIDRITFPNPDNDKYEGGSSLRIKRKLEDSSFRFLKEFCKKHGLKMRAFQKGYWTIYTPKKPSKP